MTTGMNGNKIQRVPIHSPKSGHPHRQGQASITAYLSIALG